MHLSPDGKHLFCSNAGDNTVSMYDRDDETGMLTMRFCLPISGDYPKDIAIFPDGQHLASINHDGSISFFKINYEKGLLVMSDRSIEVNEPNCCEIVKIENNTTWQQVLPLVRYLKLRPGGIPRKGHRCCR